MDYSSIIAILSLAITGAGTNFIGTTDSKSLYFKTKNTTAIVVDTNQNVGIGTATTYFYKAYINGMIAATYTSANGSTYKILLDTVTGFQVAHTDGGNYRGQLDLSAYQTSFTLNNVAAFAQISASIDTSTNIQTVAIVNSTVSTDSSATITVMPDYISFNLYDAVSGGNHIYEFPKDTGGVGYVMAVSANDGAGNTKLSFQPTSFTPSDSATIYALTPTAGTVYFCTDCTGNGFTGHPVYYAASMWRRWD